MKIKSLTLENFRCYKEKTTISFDDLTCLIGKNDAGKSTILEALDIFFEGGIVKMSPDDANVHGNKSKVVIAVTFTDLPQRLVLDSAANTTLAQEHLLNKEGDLEIYKTYDCTKQTPKPKISVYAHAPDDPDVPDLLQKSQSELRKLIKDNGLESNCKQTENPSMRNALYEHYQPFSRTERLIDLEKGDGKPIFNALKNYMPMFALFQADRSNSDQDNEVQNPMKLVVSQAVEMLKSDLDKISQEIQDQVTAAANDTLKQLRTLDNEIASKLTPNFQPPKWESLFKIDLQGDDSIPINKRGSGVRRLVLLGFFQAQAQKKKNEIKPSGHTRPIIYAIEEPETAQHPDNQIKIINALKDLSNSGDQVILTTHVPAIANEIKTDSLRFIDTGNHGTPTVKSGASDKDVLRAIVNALGILPHSVPNTGVKVAVLVEGKFDIDAISSMLKTLSDDNKINNFDNSKIFWVLGGGKDTLQDWVEYENLDKLGIHKVIIRDSDLESASARLDKTLEEWLHTTNKLDKTSAFITKKRYMESYLHPNVLKRLTNAKVNLDTAYDIDFGDILTELSKILSELFSTDKTTYIQNVQPKNLNGEPICGRTKNACKKIICQYLTPNMTVDEILERMRYSENGEDKYEILEWWAAIEQPLK